MFDRFTGRLSKEQFARKLMRKLQAAGDPREAIFDAESFQLRFYQAAKDVGRANLQNLYDEYLTRPLKDRAGFLRSVVRSLLAFHKTVPDDFDAARPDILLSLRNRSYFSLTEMQNWLDGRRDFAWPHSPIGEHLAIGLVYDLPEAMVMLQHDQLESWGISFYQAMEAAQANLSELEATFASFDNQVYVSATEDNYDASRMMIPEVIRELQVDGTPVAMVPNRDCLLVSGTDDTEGLHLMASLGADTLKQPRPMCGVAFCLNGDEWTPWLPRRKHPAHGAFRSLYVKSMAAEYEGQRDLLQQWYDGSGQNVSVAEYLVDVGQRPRQLTSYCVWTANRPWALPKTDRIFFSRNEPSRLDEPPDEISATWSAVQQILGAQMEADDTYPPRYFVRQFPSESQLATIARL